MGPIKGEWKNDLQNGIGTIEFNDGRKIKLTWENGSGTIKIDGREIKLTPKMLYEL